ncbi:MAG TPA: hypothetical protein VGD53_22745 [Actinoallomurus sp.]|jgi:hypothetical protein
MPKIGLLALGTLRHCSPSLAVVVAVAAMLAGTVSVPWGMLLPSHDVGAVILVCAIAGAGSLAVTLFLGRQVVAGSKAPAAAIRALGDGGGFSAPVDPPTAELAELGREWAATGARSPRPGNASMPWRPHGVNWWRGSCTISAPR